MKRYSLLAALALLLCAAVTIVLATPSSLAYIAAKSDIVRNTFHVVYQPTPPSTTPQPQPPQDISVPVMIQKTMMNLSPEDIGPGGFEFHLTNVETGEVTVMTSSEDGFAEAYLPFSADDVGRTYHYRLSELNTGRENVFYDKTVYDISITLLLNGNHEMVAELTVNGVPVSEIAAKFVNKYFIPNPVPDTGDDAQPVLWTAMLILSGTGFVLMSKKKTTMRRL